MGRLPRLAQAYIILLVLIALETSILSLPYLPRSLDAILSLALLTIAALVTHLFPITLPRVRTAHFTIDTAIMISVAVVFGPAAAVWSSLVSTALAKIVLRASWVKVVFNASHFSLTYGLAAAVYYALWNGPPLANFWPAIPAAVALGGVYFLLNTGLVFLIISLAERTPFPRLWRRSAQHVIVHDSIMVAVGLVFSVLWTYNRWTIPLVLPLVLVLYQSMSAVGKMARETKEALLALATVIDRRDCQTFTHSERVAGYVSWICEQLDLQADETELIVYAARLHDLGKVGVPDGLLLKPGKLTPEEQAQFRRHPDTGAEIIAQFPIFREGAEIVRCEHEWYNGQGYPRGLRGDAIPLGSRIIAVADAYEAMTTDRPYRKALPEEVAIQQLLQGCDTQFDPVAVRAFFAALQQRQQIPVAATSASAISNLAPADGAPTSGFAQAAAEAVDVGAGPQIDVGPQAWRA